MNMTDKLVRQASMCVWIEVMRVGSDTVGDPLSKRPYQISHPPGLDYRHPQLFQFRKELNEWVIESVVLDPHDFSLYERERDQKRFADES